LGDFFFSKAHLGTSRCTLAHQGAPWHIKVRLGCPGCALESQCVLWAHFALTRRTLGEFFYFQGAPWLVKRQGAPWLVKVHLGTSRCALSFQGAPWKVNAFFGRIFITKAHLRRFFFPRRTLARQGAPWAIFFFKAHLGSSRRTLGNFCFPRCTLARQGAPWHVKVHLDAPWHIKVHLGSQGAPWKAKAHLGPILCFQGAPWAYFVFPRCTLAH